MNHSSPLRSPPSLSGGCRTALRISRACRLKASGQYGSHGSGSSNASNTARLDASGRRAHHRCSVDGCPWRIDFSRAACFDTTAMGKSTSARRLHVLGITGGSRLLRVVAVSSDSRPYTSASRAPAPPRPVSRNGVTSSGTVMLLLKNITSRPSVRFRALYPIVYWKRAANAYRRRIASTSS